MISKEIAERLEAKGFPRPVNWRDRPCFVEGKGADAHYIYAPDLYELVKACGDRFGVLRRFGNGKFGAYAPGDAIDGAEVGCESPQDAVALLWLEIQCET